jgi:hypothetical protein
VEVSYPTLRYDLERDTFVVWLRWVAMEDPASPAEPPGQGIRVELAINRNTVLGPTVVWRRDLELAPVYLRAARRRVSEVLRRARLRATADIQLVIHGSIANAPYAALHLVRDYEGEAIDTAPIDATPLLQLQPSTAGDHWHVAAQANLRVRLELQGEPLRLHILDGP